MTDSEHQLICPACGKKMKKIVAGNNEFCIDICVDGCGGIFFDNQELKKFDEQNENIDFILEEYQDKHFMQIDQTKNRICPHCGAPMVKNFTSIKHEVEIDECYTCGGKFLDYGELEKIRAQYNTEAQRKEAFDTNFLAQVLKESNKNLSANGGVNAYHTEFTKDVVQETCNNSYMDSANSSMIESAVLKKNTFETKTKSSSKPSENFQDLSTHKHGRFIHIYILFILILLFVFCFYAKNPQQLQIDYNNLVNLFR